MGTLHVDSIDDAILNALHDYAKQRKQTLSQAVEEILRARLSSAPFQSEQPLDSLFALSSLWEDNASADEIIQSIRKDRHANTRRFPENKHVFD